MCAIIEDPVAFLEGESEMAALLRSFDWTGNALGAPSSWPQSLRTVVRLMLNTHHPMYIFWGESHVCLYNDAYRQSIGPERHPCSIGKPGRQVWDEIWDLIGPQILQVMEGRGATWHENQLVPITRNGVREDVYWTYSYSPIDDETASNGIGGVLVLCTETTQTVQDEARARLESARNNDFIATLSHEIRTPMSAVVGLIHILSTSEPLTARQVQWLEVLSTSAASLMDLVNQVLDISKLEAGVPDLEAIPFNFSDVLLEIKDMLAPVVSKKKLYFSGVDDCVDAREFVGDPGRVRQILLNLCSNALKFTDKGGLHVDVSCLPAGNSEFEEVVINISDTGIGIPEERLTTIFDKYRQAEASTSRKYGGSGLGLAIAKGLVDAMSGTISVESTIGSGTIFTVTLPLKRHLRL